MPLDTQARVKARPVVLPGDDGRHLDDLAGVEMVGELFNQRPLNGGRGGR